MNGKYRGKRVDNGEWVYGYKVEVNGKVYIVLNDAFISSEYGIHSYVEVIPSSVGQSTGLKDKNWWEGDICTAEYICPICFYSEPHLLTGTIEQADNGLWMFDYGHSAVPLDSEDLEILKIIGNVYDNPKLLEAEK